MVQREQFLSLLRAGLWGTNANPAHFLGDTNWKEIYRLAQQQEVVGIVYDGLMTLPIDLQPKALLFLKWYFYTLKIEQRNEQLNNVISKICTISRDEGFEAIEVKGQGIAQCYANPARRQNQTINLYLGKDAAIKIKHLANVMGVANVYTDKSSTHIHFDYEGVRIKKYSFTHNLHNTLCNRVLSAIAADWSPLQVRYKMINKQAIGLPPIEFDIPFILIHAANHFLKGAVSLSQLCDWVRLLHTYRNAIDYTTLDENIERLGLFRMWYIFGYIAVHYLGLPEPEMYFYTDSYAHVAHKTMDQIFREGKK